MSAAANSRGLERVRKTATRRVDAALSTETRSLPFRHLQIEDSARGRPPPDSDAAEFFVRKVLLPLQDSVRATCVHLDVDCSNTLEPIDFSAFNRIRLKAGRSRPASFSQPLSIATCHCDLPGDSAGPIAVTDCKGSGGNRARQTDRRRKGNPGRHAKLSNAYRSFPSL